MIMSSLKMPPILYTCFLFWMIAPSAGLGGPCTLEVVEIEVRNQDDILKRMSYPVSQTVQLTLSNDITISKSITFSKLYQCTIFTSTKGAQGHGFNISTADDTFPAILLWNTSNVLIQNVGFRLPEKTTYANCSVDLPQPDSSNANCPAISVFGSWGVQVVQGTVHGRVDILSTNQSLFDSLLIRTEASNFAAVRLSSNGDGPALKGSDVVISNCRIYGSTDGILLYRQAVGVTIAFNHFENNFFTAIECGKNVHDIGDCMLSTIVYNYIHVTPDYVTLPDYGGIYFDTHWTNPGNYLSCNYVVNGVHCIYLDWVSSGVIVDGGVCYNTTAGVKLNTGKNNLVSSFLVVEPRYQAGWISCQNYDLNNCLIDPGTFWEAKRVKVYNSLEFQQRYPYLNNFCEKTAINNIPCNGPSDPAPNVTGACSGIPTENNLRILVVDPRRYEKSIPNYHPNCAGLGNVPRLNTISSNVYSAAEVEFIDKGNLDFGVLPTSRVFRDEPGFVSCPRLAVGVQRVNPQAYAVNFNSQKSDFFPSRGVLEVLRRGN